LTDMRDAAREVYQNLVDAGCDADTIEKFFDLYVKGKTGEQLRLLSKQRRRLMEKVHEEQRKLDCLDYLIYQIKKKEESQGKDGGRPYG